MRINIGWARIWGHSEALTPWGARGLLCVRVPPCPPSQLCRTNTDSRTAQGPTLPKHGLQFSAKGVGLEAIFGGAGRLTKPQ